MSGQGGNDEAILVDLQHVPVHIDQIVFTVNSFTGQTLPRGAERLLLRLMDETNNQELTRYTAYRSAERTRAQILAKVQREAAAMGDDRHRHPANGRTFKDLIRRPYCRSPQQPDRSNSHAESGP